MKKVLFSLGLAGLMLTSCQNDEPLAGAEGTEQQVSFTLAVPEAIQTRGASYSDSKAGSLTNVDNYNVTFTAALYLQNELVWSGQKAAGNQNSVEFTTTLVIGENYKLVAYAEHNVNATKTGLDTITVETPALTETVDEFFLSTNIEAAPQMSGVLKRPYGKLRLLAEDYAEAERQFNSTIKSVEVIYTDNAKHYTTFDAVDGIFEGESVENNTKTAEVADYAADNGFKTIFADYLPVNGTEAAMFPFTVKVTFADGTTFTRDFKYDIPVKRNYVTTLTGNLFTMGSELTLIVDEEFEGEETSKYSSELEWIALNGGTYTIKEDLTLPYLEVSSNFILNIEDNVTLTSGSATNYGIIVRDGTTTINGSEDSYIDSKGGGIGVADGASVVYNGGNLTVNTSSTSGRYLFYLESEGSTATINGGKFSWSATGNQKRAYIYAGEGTTVYVTGGEFGKASTRSGYTAGILGNGTVIITGGIFGFNPSQWVAAGYEATLYEGKYYVFGKEVAQVKDVAELNVALALGKEVELVGDLAVDNESFIHTHTSDKEMVIDGNGNTIISTAESIDDFQWEDGVIPDMSTIFSSTNGSLVTVSDLNFSGTMSSLMLGHYVNATYTNFNTVFNRVNIVDAEVVSFSANISPAVTVYGTATMNNCKVYGTTLSSLDTYPMWPVYDVAVVNYSHLILNNSSIGSLYVWNQAQLTVGDGTKVESIIVRGNMNTSKYGVLIKSGATVETIDLSNITTKSRVNITIENGATIGKFVSNGIEYASIDEWRNS